MPEGSKRIAIMQPGYLPWLGFYELMHNCDLFVFLDDVHYTTRDWRNRNRIRTHDGWQWLSVPVLHKNKRCQLIKDVRIDNDEPWNKKHLRALEINYRRSRFFDRFYPELRAVYARPWEYLCQLNTELIGVCCRALSIQTPCICASTLDVRAAGSERILEICKALNAYTLYDSKAAANFLDVSLFEKERIIVEFQDYRHPVYEQVYAPFIPFMSAVDLIFNHGPEASGIVVSGRSCPGT
ncbi:MAG: WbqC family protein [Candidatus Omnitrophica bacterium]|nr:WbqC family protein [Candidatus Omnitrophota bacterium]